MALAFEIAEMVTEYEAEQLREQIAAAWRAGYRTGYAMSESDTAAAWRPIAERVRRDAGRPSWTELQQIRADAATPEHIAEFFAQARRLHDGRDAANRTAGQVKP